MDRIDLHVEVPAVPFADLSEKPPGEKSESIRERVEAARQVQLERFNSIEGKYCNAHMETKDIRKFCDISEEGKSLLKSAMDKLGLSARAYDRILKVGGPSPTWRAELRSNPNIWERQSSIVAWTGSCGCRRNK